MNTLAVALPKEIFWESGIDKIFYDEYSDTFVVHGYKGEVKTLTREQLECEMKHVGDIALDKQVRYLLDWCRIYVTARKPPVPPASPATPRRSQLLLLT